MLQEIKKKKKKLEKEKSTEEKWLFLALCVIFVCYFKPQRIAQDSRLQFNCYISPFIQNSKISYIRCSYNSHS